jgi:hypothetical protein
MPVSFRACLLLALSFAAAGCAPTAPRVLLLRNFGSVVPGDVEPSLRGAMLRILPSTDARTSAEDWGSVASDECDGMDPLEPTRSAETQWHEALSAAKAAGSGPRHQIGSPHNLHTVSSVNSPIDWLDETMRDALTAQGVDVRDEDGDFPSVRFVLRHMSARLDMTTQCVLAVDVVVTDPGGSTRTETFAAYGSKVAWMGSSWEYYLAARRAGALVAGRALRWIAGGR